MKLKLIFITTLFFIFTISINAQTDSSKTKTCIHPYSFKFDEFLVKDSEDTAKRLEEFKKRFEEETKEAIGIIHVYGGKKSSVYEIKNLVAEVENFFGINSDNRYKEKFRVYDADYRTKATIEMFIKLQECSKYPETTSDFTFDEVEFTEITSKNTLEKSNADLSKLISKKTKIECTPAGKAVGICSQNKNVVVEVFIIIDTNGKVIYSKGVSGHPLLKSNTSTKIKDWTFHPVVIKNKPFNVKGILSVEIEPFNEQIVNY